MAHHPPSAFRLPTLQLQLPTPPALKSQRLRQGPDSTPLQEGPRRCFHIACCCRRALCPISDPSSTSSGLSPDEDMRACDPERAMFRELYHAVSCCSCNDCRLTYSTGVDIPFDNHPCRQDMPLKANEGQRTAQLPSGAALWLDLFPRPIPAARLPGLPAATSPTPGASRAKSRGTRL